MQKLSVVISAYNEEKKIKDCLESVKDIADEIVFVDNSSTDDTVEIAKRYTSAIFVRPNNPMLNVNKNFGFEKAKSDWILSLDADERVSTELGQEIDEKIRNSKFEIRNSRIDGYFLPRKNIIFGKWVEHTGWYPDHQLRLFRNGKGKFPERHVHEMVKIEGKAEYLKYHIIHYNYDTVDQFLEKLLRIYTTNEAEQLLQNGYVVKWHDAIRFPVKEFLSRFFAREGYKDGFHGLMLSLLMAFYQFIVFAKIWERQGFKEYDVGKILGQTDKEFKLARQQLQFWLANEMIKETSNVIKKNVLRVKRKLSVL